MSNDDDLVEIAIPRDQAIALFEWSYRFRTDGNPQFTHPADAIAIDRVSSELERTLAEPFRDDYPPILAASRDSAVAKYRSHMGVAHSAWLERLEYQDDPTNVAV